MTQKNITHRCPRHKEGFARTLSQSFLSSSIDFDRSSCTRVQNKTEPNGKIADGRASFSISASLCSQFQTFAQQHATMQTMAPLKRPATSMAVLSSTGTLGTASSFVEQARQLKLPTRDEMLSRRDHHFWNSNAQLLEKAWQEWPETPEGKTLPALDSSLYHPKLRAAIEASWKDPSKEHLVRDLWKEVSPGVYQCEFFDPEKIHVIREYLDKAAEADIPTRPPYGIVLNRNGFMIDKRSIGYLAIPEFQSFYRDLMDTYMRPLGRLFFPEYIQSDEDSNTFGFTIQYQAGKDHSIRQHSDSSSLTLNINLNLPDGEDYSGSSLYFVDPATGKKNYVSFSPGVAIMHRGATQHAALPITSGERSNMVLWLMGKNGYTGYYPYGPEEQMSAEERWTKPTQEEYDSMDTWAPF